MNRCLKLIVIPFLVLYIFAGGAWALDLGADITIFDQREGSTGYFGTTDVRTAVREDNEVEPGMQAQQRWDLEAFFLKGYKLSMVGGWDFINTVADYSYTSGDIFIDIDNNAVFGVDEGSFDKGYDYVFDVNWNQQTYNVYSIDDGILSSVTVWQNDSKSNPWRFSPTDKDNKINSVADMGFGFDEWTGTEGDTHYAVSGFDLSYIYLDNSNWDGVFTSHFTMECGNDNLMGKGVAPAPEPATMLLLGTGLIGLAGASRKKFKK